MLILIFSILFFTIFFLFFFKEIELLKIKKFSLISSGLVLILSTIILIDFDTNKLFNQNITSLTIGAEHLNFIYMFGFDGISLLFFFLSAFLIFICILFIWDDIYFSHYIINLFLIEIFLLIIFSTLDLFIFYIFFEAILVPMFLIIGIFGSRERKIRAVYLFFFYTLCGSILMLISILYMYIIVGSLNFEQLNAWNFTETEQLFLWLTFFLSFASKMPLFPFHIWLPEAHVEAPTVGSVLLAGILLKLGVYGFLRFSLVLFPDASLFYTPIVYLLSVLGIIFASLTAIRQTDMKRVIAYSSVAHMNMVMLGLFSFNSIGLQGAMIQSLSHGFVAGGMFLMIGILYNRYHSRYIYYYGGLVTTMPSFSAVFLILTLANIALPGTSSFIGEFLILTGIYKTNVLISLWSALGIILCGSYSLWLYNRLIFGNVKIDYTINFEDLTQREYIILIPIVFFVLIIGIKPSLLTEYFDLTSYSLFLK